MRPTFSAERIFGGTLLAMCSNDFICFYDWAECRLIRRIDVTVKVSGKILNSFLLFPATLPPVYTIIVLHGNCRTYIGLIVEI